MLVVAAFIALNVLGYTTPGVMLGLIAGDSERSDRGDLSRTSPWDQAADAAVLAHLTQLLPVVYAIVSNRIAVRIRA
ncbi:hypothetical protein ASG92_12990 [Arthrobacter sp. Soil736]|nr:hypothetical protein ASG92_12990 [Arthrobacter sp. Soil736]